MKKILGLLTVLLSAGMLMGCLGVKNLTEEEEAQISEYAAALLLKYDVNYKNLLWEAGEDDEEDEEEPVKEEKPEETKPVETKPQETASGSAVAGADAEKVESKGLAEIFGLSGVDIQYSGCEFVKSFPAEGKHDYLIPAEEGRKLLIVKFQMKNNTQEAVKVDILSGMPSFRMHFNEEDIAAKMTIILEDLSTMIEDIPAGATVEKVLVGEVSESFPEQLTSLSLTTRFNGATYRTLLAP